MCLHHDENANASDVKEPMHCGSWMNATWADARHSCSTMAQVADACIEVTNEVTNTVPVP